ncbi:MAG: hypothetical protein A4E57_03840 [Syntrophorhabdaceae bacterium PtaU1.Bin034]|nr:MAG: hypothetical protein A4E57_03840 [Syntrophorhabdaceae bacterium PtaU1.Bin034]
MSFVRSSRALFGVAVAAFLCFGLLAAATFICPAVFAQGNEFYYCTDKNGAITITNKRYDEKNYRCEPFAALNREFKHAAEFEKKQPRPTVSRAEAEAKAAAEAARTSAQSAAIAMQAAQASADAAHLTAESTRRALTPYYIIVRGTNTSPIAPCPSQQPLSCP